MESETFWFRASLFFFPPPMCLNQIKICYLLIKKSGKKVNWVQRNESKQWKRNTRYMTFASDETAALAVIARHSIKYTALKRLESLTFSTHTFFFASFTPMSSSGKRKSAVNMSVYLGKKRSAWLKSEKKKTERRKTRLTRNGQRRWTRGGMQKKINKIRRKSGIAS